MRARVGRDCSGNRAHAPIVPNQVPEQENGNDMSTDNNGVDWAAALADIEARIAKLQATADTIREVLMASGSPTAPGGGKGPSGGGIRPDTFLKLSIPDAAKKFLEMERAKQSTQDIMDALEKGGLPPSKYNTVYSILSRREKVVGDIINMKGDWALAEWYPNHRPKAKKDAPAGPENAKKDAEKATA
jgi:hypothetical protein